MDEDLAIFSPIGAETALAARLRAFVEGIWRLIRDDDQAITRELRDSMIEGLGLWVGQVDRIHAQAIRSTFRRFFSDRERGARTELALAAEIETAVNAALIDNVALIDNLDAQQRRLVREIIRNPTETPTEQRLRRALEIGKTRARIIARDQTAKLNSALSEQRHRAAGASRYEWSTSADERVRDLHANIDGTVYRYGEPTGAEGGLPPGQPILCRCVALPVFEPLSDAT